MNFKRFSVGTTNIFPVANSTAGGQLLTEYNLRSRESVSTNQDVKYMIGPSYVHSMDDYYVRIQQDDSNVKISSSTLEILPGRAVVNGHFIESLAPILIDLAAANASRESGQPALKGELSVGLKVMYSTTETMAGSMLVENNENVYEGIQVVVLPRDQFILPWSTKDSREDESIVTAHIKLADFIYLNGTIINIVQNTEKVKSLSADRIGDVDKLLSNVYVTKTGLNTQNHHYVFSSKCKDDKIQDTWCPADESLMIWDSNPQMQSFKKNPNYPTQATFGISSNGRTIQLCVPHKQVDGAKDTEGTALYMPPRYIDIPVADYTSNSPGTVDSNYTSYIKKMRSELNNIYLTIKGKQVHYIDSLDSRDKLPPINSNWNAGDYILVGDDQTVENSTDASTVSTMYVILPGRVLSVSKPTKSDTCPYTGVQLDYKESDEAPNTTDSTIFNAIWAFDKNTNYRGTKGIDYFTYGYTTSTGDEKKIETYFYPVDKTDVREYSSPIFVTGQVPLAQTERVGGFYNVDESARDNGYIWLDETGHLQLLDYALLRSGTLAYQLGQNWDSGSGLTIDSIQEALDDEVNIRVAFANAQHESWVEKNMNDGARTDVIHVYVRLSEDSEDITETKNLFIRGIDSRFNTSVYLHVTGNTNVPVEVYIINCEKIRIDNNIPANVHFNVAGSCLYYDAEVLDNIYAEDISLWYTRYSTDDPNLLVDGMTVKEVDAPAISTDISYWDEDNPNDLHYKYALNSITFGSDASIIGLSIVVRNDCTDNIELGSRIIVGKFELLQGNGFTYPVTKLTRNLKLSGSFITAYRTKEDQDLGEGFIVYDSNVTVTTDQYDGEDTTMYAKGTISIYVKSEFVTNVIGLDADTSIDGWRTDEYHIISGGVV